MPLDRRHLLFAALTTAIVGPAAAFDRAAAGERYRTWLSTLYDDLRKALAVPARDEEINVDDIGRRFSRSIVPGSRAARNFARWVAQAQARGLAHAGGEIVFAGPLLIFMRLLSTSVPAGHGGGFPEPAGSQFASADKALSVWYMHIDGGEYLKRYFDDKRNFDRYRLPPEGRLERNAYPFLMFEDQDAGLRLGGFGGEFFGAAVVLDQIQYQ